MIYRNFKLDPNYDHALKNQNQNNLYAIQKGKLLVKMRLSVPQNHEVKWSRC